MQVFENYSLKEYNSFGLDVKAKKFIIAKSVKDFEEISKKYPLEKKMILGEGTNVLFTGDYEGIVILNKISYLTIIKQDSTRITFEAGAGFSWDKFVEQTAEQSLFAAVNLSGIPGTVGAAPVQNIGAYGTEVKEIIAEVRFFSFEHNKIINFKPEQCLFAYRNSIFKSIAYKGAIVNVIFEFNKRQKPNLAYKDLQNAFKKNEIITPKNLRNKILNIRKAKLPDYKKIPNTGSFFKNPYIYKDFYMKLKEKYPQMPAYKITSEVYKIPAGWLIDKAGLKGYKLKRTKVYEKNALVLVNFNSATPDEIIELMNFIKKIVFDKFKILLTPEVVII